MRVAKWGNSLAVRLPQALVAELSLKAGDELVVVESSREQLVVAKDRRRAGAIEKMAQRNWKLPEGYKFDRDEANER